MKSVELFVRLFLVPKLRLGMPSSTLRVEQSINKLGKLCLGVHSRTLCVLQRGALRNSFPNGIWERENGYVLDDDTAVMSERGTANLLGVDHMLLNRMETNWPPKTLKPFIDKGWSMETNWPPKTLKSFIDEGSTVETNLRRREKICYNTWVEQKSVTSI
jgi:hypothetical protein